MGRKEISAELKKLSGTLRKDRIKNGVQFDLISEVPEPENFLPASAKKIFKNFAQMLIDKRMLYNSDLHLLAIMAEEMNTYIIACKKLKTATSYVMKLKGGYTQQSPWLGIRNQAQGNVRAIGSSFGLDPLSRSKFGGDKKEDVKENPFTNL